MPELRRNPVTDQWVIIAAERVKRPHDFRVPREERRHTACPFCGGHEEETPPEIWAYRQHGTAKNSPGWWVRTVPNKYPALTIDNVLAEKHQGIYQTMSGVGAHEVIIETPRHLVDFEEHPVEQVEEIIRMWRDRYCDLRKDPRIRYIQIFKNHGLEGGASIEHTHCQLIATPRVPKSIEDELAHGIRPYREETGRCIFCDMVSQEKYARERMVLEAEHFVAFCPHASRFPFETWIIPKRHREDFGAISEYEIKSLAWLLREVIERLARALGNPPYNLIVHTSPVNTAADSGYHWHIEILPRLTRMAGFEFGTDYFINPTPPEMAARYLRESKPPELRPH